MDIGERIKQRRESLGLSQEELAHKVGYKSRSSINKIEIDGRGLPQKKIYAFAVALETTPAYLMGWTDDENIPAQRTKKIVHVFRPKKGAPPIPTIQLSNKQIFSNSDKVFIKTVEEILDELLDDEQKEEFNQKLDERLPKFPSKEMTLAAHFDGDDLTEDELKEIRQFAEFVKNKRKS